jgi:hypothetical protein
MQFFKTKECIILPVLAIIIVFTILSLSGLENQYANSQSNEISSTANTTSTGVELEDIRTSPLHLKSGSIFQVIATVVNDSPIKITFTAGACESPITAQFLKNVVTRSIQGCSATSPPFELQPQEKVSVAGPSSDTIYQALASGQTTASATFYYQTEDGQAASITQPFVSTIG